MRFSTVIASTLVLLAARAVSQTTLITSLGSSATATVDSSSSSVASGTTTDTATGIFNTTSILSGAIPTGTGINGTKNSTAMGLGVHAAQYVLPGVAAVGAVAYSGFFGL